MRSWTLALLPLLLAAVPPRPAEAGIHFRVVVTAPPPPKRHPPRRRRPPAPGPGWVWVAGHPGPGGSWVPGHWVYKGPPPRPGWVYVTGYWDGTRWVPGFWRPPSREGFVWVEGYVAEDGTYVPGYWKPVKPGPPGTIWRPGYWDGTRWVPGRWVKAENVEVYGEDGELDFFAVGDGEIEQLAIADPGETLDGGEPGGVEEERQPEEDEVDTGEPAAGASLHHAPPGD